MYQTFDEALNAFLEDLTVSEDGAPCIDADNAWSIIRDHDGGFYLSSYCEDYRDEVMVKAGEIPDLWCISEPFLISDTGEVNWLKGVIAESCGY